MEIQHYNDSKKGYFKAFEKEVEAGILTYTWAGDSKFIIDHTEIKEKFEGQGIGKKLVLAASAFARTNTLKIIPLCPFAKAFFDKNQKEFEAILFK